MIIQHHTYRLAEGVDQADFLAADERAQQEFAPFQMGFIRRTTARTVGGDTWLTEWLWSDLEAASACGEAASSHEAMVAMGEMIDPDSETISTYQTREWIEA